MNCDICHGKIMPWQDRHSTSQYTVHSSCEVGDTPIPHPDETRARSYKLNWFSGRVSIDPKRARDE